MRRWLLPKTTLWFLPTIWFLSVTIYGQQPFVTDDADVTERGKLHFEFRNSFDLLQRSSFPNLKQDTANFELDYGLLKNVELGISAPLITLFNARETSPRTAAGIGDANLSIKYNFRKEHMDSKVPAMSVQLNIEAPTGDVERKLGSGLTDVWINGVAQKTLSHRTILRVNTGVLFAGNTTTGVIGIRSRGTVFTGGSSLVRKFTSRLQLGVELTGALTTAFELSRGQLQTLIGGNYEIKEGLTIDLGVVGGHYSASPRVGAVLGLSIDF